MQAPTHKYAPKKLKKERLFSHFHNTYIKTFTKYAKS